MNDYVFVGPSLPPSEVARLTHAQILPPVRQGDVQRLLCLNAVRRIAIIDGYFAHVPAVWHKEILAALHQGVDVIGGCSMGALRAAELAPFGMRGVGVVFAALRDGHFPGFEDEVFEDDDEVAVVHGPVEAGYRPISDAMVNLRATLNRARDHGIIDDHAHALLARGAKRLFYPLRSQHRMLDAGVRDGLTPKQRRELEAWWHEGYVDQKAIDARAVLTELSKPVVTSSPPRFDFQHTSAYQALTRTQHDSSERCRSAVLEELGLDPQAHRIAVIATAAKLLGVEASSDGLASVLDSATQCAGSDFLSAQTLRTALEQWLDATPREVLDRHLMDWINTTGRGARIAERAEHKNSLVGASEPLPSPTSLHEIELLELEDWYFSQCLRIALPQHMDEHARAMGFSDLRAFHIALLREYRYRAAGGAPSDGLEHLPMPPQ